MALPYSRNTAYSPGSTPVSGNDLNALQDEVIRLHTEPDVVGGTAFLPFAAGGGSSGSQMAPLLANYDVGGAGGAHSLSAVILRWTPMVRVGRKVIAIAFRLAGNASATATIRAAHFDGAAPVSIGSSALGAISATLQEYTLDVTDTVLSSGSGLRIEVEASAANIAVYQARIIYAA